MHFYYFYLSASKRRSSAKATILGVPGASLWDPREDFSVIWKALGSPWGLIGGFFGDRVEFDTFYA